MKQPNARRPKILDRAQMTPADFRGLICDPRYVSIGAVSKELWIVGAIKNIQDEGAEQFFTNLLHLLGEEPDWKTLVTRIVAGMDIEVDRVMKQRLDVAGAAPCAVDIAYGRAEGAVLMRDTVRAVLRNNGAQV